jgi:hypothetical protein
MAAPATQQALVPPAARLHVGYCDERLRAHRSTISRPRLTGGTLKSYWSPSLNDSKE